MAEHGDTDGRVVWSTGVPGEVWTPGPSADGPRNGARQLVGVLVVLLVMLTAAGVAWLRSSDAEGRSADVDRVPMVVPDVDATPRTTTSGVGPSGVEVVIESNAQVLAGARTPIAVTVRNIGTGTVYWEAGGCGFPVVVTVEPAGFDNESGSSIRVSREPVWDGDLDSLDDAVSNQAAAMSSVAFTAQPASMIGVSEVMCTGMSVVAPFEPGETLSYQASAEMRAPPGPLPGNGTYQIVARFSGHSDPSRTDDTKLEPVEARAELVVVDHPARTIARPDDLVAVAVDDGRLADWLTTTVVLGQPDLRQSYRVGLSWWREAWELWIDPKFSSGSSGSLRLRIDPDATNVQDARIVAHGAAPNDEPGADALTPVPDTILERSNQPDQPNAIATPNTATVGDTVTVAMTDANVAVCNTMAIIYEVAGDKTLTAGILIDTDTWVSAPAQVPMTIPPCLPGPSAGAYTYTVPDVSPGDYLICLTRDADACATIEVKN